MRQRGGRAELPAAEPAWPNRAYAAAMNQSASPSVTSQWICESCGFIYDPDDGDPDGGIPPGTAFEDIPDTWFCPVCGARKMDYVPYED
ncbi:MAG: Rubredoxin-type Fe(Cys)4 protein [Solirubrobacterales bacterium]|nr:Rubredoxin-type Fe(Cys)4 protein [Solirubrobacterales bacterium]